MGPPSGGPLLHMEHTGLMKTICLSAALLGALLFPLSSSAQLCKNGKPEPAPAGRYQTQADGTVLDTQLGLQWQACTFGLKGKGCSEGKTERLTAPKAWEMSVKLNRQKWLGHDDWRVPTIAELESLRKADCVDPAIDLSVFPRSESNWYWSSSAESGDQFDYWYLDFKDGVKEQDDKNLASFIRFVRTYKK